MYDATTTIKVEARIIGKRRPTPAPRYVPLPLALLRGVSGAKNPFRLRDLIEYIVCEEVRAFQQRQEEHRLLPVLSPQELTDAAGRGKIAMGGADDSQHGQHNSEVDEHAAVQIALQGFVDGLYLVFLDGQQQHDLDAPVQPHPASTLLFLRLVALAGG
jgi:hypothetical protein